jgi:hypothetical protein
MTIDIPNFLSRAESIGFSYNGQFMTSVRYALSAKRRSDYATTLGHMEAAALRLECSTAYKGYLNGRKHARTATAASMMEDLQIVILALSNEIA